MNVPAVSKWLLPPAVFLVAAFVSGCGGSSEGDDLTAYQAEDAIALAARQLEVASWVAEDGQVHEDLVEYFPPDTGGAVEIKLRSISKDSERLNELPAEVSGDLNDAAQETRLAVKGMSSLNEAISLWNEAWNRDTEVAARKAHRAFGDVLNVPDEVDQHLTESVEATLDAAEQAQAILDELGRLDSVTERKVEQLSEKAEIVKAEADDLGDDRESQLVMGRQNLSKHADHLAALAAAPVLPEGACAVIPAEDLNAFGVDITVYAENCNEDSIDLVHQIYADSNYISTGNYDDGSSSCVTAGAWERFMSTCQTPFGEVSFTAPGSA